MLDLKYDREPKGKATTQLPTPKKKEKQNFKLLQIHIFNFLFGFSKQFLATYPPTIPKNTLI